MGKLVIKNNVRKVVRELDPEKHVSSIALEVEEALEQKTMDILKNGIERAKANKRSTLLARDL